MNLHDLITFNKIMKLKNELKKTDINLNIKNKYSVTPFFRACGNIAQLLIRDPRPATLGVDINTSDLYGITAFEHACDNSDIDNIKLFI